MKEFVQKLTKEQFDFLKSIKQDFEEMNTVDLDEWLTNYFQEQGLEDIDNNPQQLLLESILDVLGEI